MSLPALALRRPVTTVAATLALVLLGAVSLGRLPVSLLPDVTLPVLTIRTTYTSAAAPEVSRFIAEPIEEAVGATPGLVELRSVSRNGQATTTARFAWGTDMAATVLIVRERLDNARARLPERAERPISLTSDPGERPIAILAITGSGGGDLRSLSPGPPVPPAGGRGPLGPYSMPPFCTLARVQRGRQSCVRAGVREHARQLEESL
jgi:HAE1 family hydrophobic/amphiphilic exporter-1